MNKTRTYEYKDLKDGMRYLVKNREDYMKLRISSDNRLSKKADGTDQKKLSIEYKGKDVLDLVDIKDAISDTEKLYEKKINTLLKLCPVYNEFLCNVKGIGPMTAAVIISEIDIEEASNVSKLWQFAGCNPGLVRGKKKDKDGGVIVTDEWIRGDRLTAGYLAPYNKFLKMKLLGVLADSFIKCRSPYTEYYYNMKERLENSKKEYKDGRKWSEESKAHRDRAAKRYMIKMFLIDLYRNWREIEGLPVRNLYQEEYLGKVHGEI